MERVWSAADHESFGEQAQEEHHTEGDSSDAKSDDVRAGSGCRVEAGEVRTEPQKGHADAERDESRYWIGAIAICPCGARPLAEPLQAKQRPEEGGEQKDAQSGVEHVVSVEACAPRDDCSDNAEVAHFGADLLEVLAFPVMDFLDASADDAQRCYQKRDDAQLTADHLKGCHDVFCFPTRLTNGMHTGRSGCACVAGAGVSRYHCSELSKWHSHAVKPAVEFELSTAG